MQELKVPRPSDLALVASIPRSWEPGGRAFVEVAFRDLAPISVELGYRHFLVWYILAMAAVKGETDLEPEAFRGFMTTEAIRREYARQVGVVAPPQPDAIWSYVHRFRSSVHLVLGKLRERYDIRIDPKMTIIEHRNGFGYRCGEPAILIRDYRETSGDA